jgi:hypothetical protein
MDDLGHGGRSLPAPAPSTGCRMTAGQPPITRGSGIVSAPWIAGPREGTQNPVVVSFTDFAASSQEDQQRIFEMGLKLRENWPIMHGAVGLWLWAKPEELRGGSLSVWDDQDDLRRFIRWPLHAAIMREWRDRISVLADTWESDRFIPAEAWARAEARMRRPRQELFIKAERAPS